MPQVQELPAIQIQFEGKKIDVPLPCQRFLERYEKEFLAEVENSRQMWEHLWEETCDLFQIREDAPTVFLIRGQNALANSGTMVGSEATAFPISFTPERSTLILHKPYTMLNAYSYYVKKEILGQSPVFGAVMAHEFSHTGFIHGGNGRGYKLELIYRATAPFINPTYLQYNPFLGILPDNNFPLSKLALLHEAPAYWGEEIIGEKLFRDAREQTEREIEFHYQLDRALNPHLGKYVELSKIIPEQNKVLRLAHWRNVRGKSLDEVYEYLEKETERLVGIDVRSFYENFDLFVRLERGGIHAPRPNEQQYQLWKTLLKEEFSYEE